MSRRKQSNPKPLKREDEEWGDESDSMAADRRSPGGDSAASTSPPAPSSRPTPTPPPRLRLNTSLATDPARTPLAAAPPTPSPPPPNAPPYVCTPCGIRYSSLSTLQAHRDHYCSHRRPADHDEDSGSEARGRHKQYACGYCSYSADKKVSLNRHMRMHSASPGAPPAETPPAPVNGDAPDGEPAPHDRYCADCDIRFSSVKTFRAHKTHYCSTRQVLKATRGGSSGTSGSAPPSPGAPASATPAPPDTGPRLALALPTNPILIVPYSLLRGASALPGAALPDPDAPCFLLPDGTIRPVSRALAAAAAADLKDAEVLKVANRSRDCSRDATAPLDLSVRRAPPVPPPSDHEKENRLTPELIVCAPELPASPAHVSPSPSPRRSASPAAAGSSPKRRRRSSASPPTAMPPPLALRLSEPQVLVKQGVSKCRECNIVFCKYENYRVHKRHYCAAGAGEERGPEPGHYRQLICLACGIKFSSLDNLATHQSYYCLKRETRSPRAPAPAGPEPTGTPGPAPGGWKCPCCDVVSPTATAAQRHMESHAGVRAFRCTICRYRGNTLRGMRTHIRMHFPKKPADLQEESYIACVVEDDARDSPSPSSGGSDRVHRCSSCAYTSTYRGNVVRHARLVHAVDEPESPPRPPTPPTAPLDIKKEPEEPEESQGPNYCKSCDISFKYVNTFKAHKQFYCPTDAAANNNVPPPAARVTEAPVI